MSGRLELLYAAPDRIVIDFDRSQLKFTQGYDGQVAWLKDQNDQIIELSGNDKKRLINTAYLTGQAYLFNNRLSGVVDFLRDTLIERQTYKIFLAIPQGGDSIWLYFNPGNKRIEISIEYIDEIPIYTYMSDFRTVEGVEFPTRFKSESPLPQFNSLIELSDIRINLPISDTLFSMVDQGASDYAFPSGADSIKIPIKYFNGHIFLEVSIGGRRIYFILDSGAGINVIDKKFADSLELRYSGDLPAKGISGYQSAAITRIDSITIGEIGLFHQEAAVVDLTELSLGAPRMIGGLLGYDLLSRFPFRVDYDNEKLILYNPDNFRPPDSALEIGFEFVMKIPSIQAEIDSHEGRFLIDIGNSLGIILHRAFIDRYDLMNSFTDIREMRGGIGGVGGYSKALMAVGNSFRLGEDEVKKPPLLIAAGDAGVLKSNELDGNIGNLMLQKFSILINYRSQKLYILQHKEL